MSYKIPKTVEIRIIGPQDSGKTTYLATLARFPQHKYMKSKFPEFKIEPEGIAAENLRSLAEDIIEKGAKIAGTMKGIEAELPFYYFRITIPAIKGQPSMEIELNARDFSGEIFHDISKKHKRSSIQDFVDDLFTAQGWFVMLTDYVDFYDPSSDTTKTNPDQNLYLAAFKELFEEIEQREKINPEVRNLRIAVVMAKCERGELWTGRLDPEEDLFKVRLPKTHEFLSKKFPARVNRLKFFACSSFGVMSDRPEDFDPRPNRVIPDEDLSANSNAHLRNVDQWNPYGLVAPIYWLATGKVLHDQRI